MAEVIAYQTPAAEHHGPTRRAILGGLAVASTIGTASAVAAANATDPHVEWIEEWRRLKTWVDNPTNRPGLNPEETAEFWRWIEVEKLIASTQAKTLEGMAAQVEILAEEFLLYPGEEPDATYNAVHNLRRSLQQLAEGA